MKNMSIYMYVFEVLFLWICRVGDLMFVYTYHQRTIFGVFDENVYIYVFEVMFLWIRRYW